MSSIHIKMKIVPDLWVRTQYILFSFGYRWVNQANSEVQVINSECRLSNGEALGVIIHDGMLHTAYGFTSERSSWVVSDGVELSMQEFVDNFASVERLKKFVAGIKQKNLAES